MSSRNEEQLEDFYKNQFSKLALEKYKGVLSYRNLKKITRKSYSVLDSFDTVLIADVFKVAVPILFAWLFLYGLGDIQRGLDGVTGSSSGDLGSPSTSASEGAIDLANALSFYTPAMTLLVVLTCAVSCIAAVLGILKNALRGVYYFMSLQKGFTSAALIKSTAALNF